MDSFSPCDAVRGPLDPVYKEPGILMWTQFQTFMVSTCGVCARGLRGSIGAEVASIREARPMTSSAGEILSII